MSLLNSVSAMVGEEDSLYIAWKLSAPTRKPFLCGCKCSGLCCRNMAEGPMHVNYEKLRSFRRLEKAGLMASCGW